MSYLRKVMDEDETLILAAKVHWIVYVRGFAVILLGLALGIYLSEYLFALCAVGLVLLIPAWIYSATTELAVTDRKAIAKWGLITRETIEQSLSTIDSVRVSQSLLGRMLDYGSIEVTGSGFSTTPMKNIANPLAFRRAVDRAEHQMKQARSR